MEKISTTLLCEYGKENGGEFHIKERDIQKQKEIVEFLECGFIRLRI